jgi:hypothetical protein
LRPDRGSAPGIGHAAGDSVITGRPLVFHRAVAFGAGFGRMWRQELAFEGIWGDTWGGWAGSMRSRNS